jgi:hypothetical protein
MGKKTDKYMSDLSALGNTCKGRLQDLVQIAMAMDKNGVLWDKVAFPYSNYYNKLHGQGMTTDDQKAKDPNFKKLAEAYEKVQAERDGIWAQGKQQCRVLQDDLNKMNTVLGDFARFVDKKAKSKNPFKSKKSLPVAQETVKKYQAFHATGQKAVQQISQGFR